MDETLLLHELNHLHGDDKWGHLAAPLGDLLDAKNAEIARLRAEVREAFRAGWLTNAIPPDQHEAGAEYVRDCEEVDWQEWQKAPPR